MIQSKIGGIPDVEKTFVWPTINSMQYIFLAQYNCEELTPEFYEYGFPRKGLISIFVPCFESDLEETFDPNEVKVFYFNSIDSLKPYSEKEYNYRKKIGNIYSYNYETLNQTNQLSDDLTINYIAQMRAEMRQKKLQNKKIKDITLDGQSYEEIKIDLFFLEEKRMNFQKINDFIDPVIYENYIEKNNRIPLITDKKLENRDFFGKALGWVVGFQGLNNEIINQPEEWVNILFLFDHLDMFTMYIGHVPDCISVAMRKKDLIDQKFSKALAFQDWD